MAWNIEFNIGDSYEIDHEPTKEDIEDFKNAFISDILDGYIEITDSYYELDEEEAD